MKLPFLDRHNRSRLEARQVAIVERQIAPAARHHVASVWEDLARASVPSLPVHGGGWGVARRWWGPGLDRKPLEIDLVAEDMGGRMLVGEVRWSSPSSAGALLRQLEQKIARMPLAAGREVIPMLWLEAPPKDLQADKVPTPRRVLEALR